LAKQRNKSDGGGKTYKNLEVEKNEGIQNQQIKERLKQE
jgi:hypothetical protein